MSMPKGYKKDHGYSTVAKDNGLGYREIAEIMTDRGDKMNHSTARNIFMSAMRKFAVASCGFYEEVQTDDDIKRISNDPRFQEGLLDMIKEI